MRRALLALLLSLSTVLVTGCAPPVWGGPARHAAVQAASTVAAVGRASADVAASADGLIVLIAVLGKIGDAAHTGTAGGPSDEAYAARMRSAHIHANDPWVAWPKP